MTRQGASNTSNQLNRLPWKGPGGAWATPEGAAALKQADIHSLSDLEAFEGGDLIHAGGHRRVRRLISPEGRTFYLKQSFRAHQGGVLASLLRRGRRLSSAEIETRNMIELASLGIPCAAVAAYGADIRGLRERSSFLLTEDVGGEELTRYWGGGVAGFPRSNDNDNLLFDKLLSLVVALAENGVCFQDLVPKHIFMDSDSAGVLELRLIDVARIRFGHPNTATDVVNMIAKLNANLPLAAVSSATRARFCRKLEQRLKIALFHDTVRETERLLRRRRHRFILSPHPRPPEKKLRHTLRGGAVWWEDKITELVHAGIELENTTMPDLDPESSPFAACSLSRKELRMLVNLHRVLHGWVALDALCGWRLPESDNEPCWALWQVENNQSLAEKLSTATAAELKVLGAAIGAVVRALLLVGVVPEGSWIDWMFWQSDQIHLGPKPPFRTGDLNADKAKEDLRSQISSLIGPERCQEVLSGLTLELPGLLGGTKRLIRS